MHIPILYCSSLLFLLFSGVCCSQPWAWVNGSNQINPLPVFGAQGIAAPSNSPGGRGFACSCFNAATGTFWLFGGWSTPVPNNNSSYYSQDLWKYELATGQWTWMKGPSTVNTAGIYGTLGVPAAANNPGSRISGVMWVDNAGDLWLFGGFGYIGSSLGSFNDLWKYDVSTNEWTWMKGSNALNSIGNYGVQGIPALGNNPPARHGAKGFKDSQGNLCLFGGSSQYPNSILGRNDIWRYSATTNEWTWIKGSNLGNQNGSYGTQGMPALANNPGSRSHTALWQDNNSDIWIFGGYGMSTNSSGYLNDLWKYEWSTNSWTWITGNDQLVNQPGIYGVMGIGSASNLAGARWGSATWIDNAGDFWLFGGIGYIPNTLSPPELNDLWKYEVSSNTFIWKKGTNSAWSLGNYGPLGVASPSYYPSGREESAYWKDANGNFWLFGGQGVASSMGMGLGETGDLWCLQQCTFSIIPIVCANSVVCQGNAVMLSANGAGTYSWSNSQTTAFTVVWPSASAIFSLTGLDLAGCAYTSTIPITVKPNLLNIISSKDTVCTGEMAILTATGCIAYNWVGLAGVASVTVSPIIGTNYQVFGLDTSGCTFSHSHFISVLPCTGIKALSEEERDFSVYPNPSKGEFFVETNSASDLLLMDGLGQTIVQQRLDAGKNSVELDNPVPGTYYLRVSNASRNVMVKTITLR